MSIEPSKLVNFIHKTVSIKQNAVWKEVNYAELVTTAASHDTYLETVNNETMPNADTLHYRLEKDTSVNALFSAFLSLTKKHLKKLKGRKAILIIDYTCEPFFGKTQDEWVHGYRPRSGSRGCYKFLAASLVMDDQRYFFYTKPVNTITDEAFEIMQIIAHARLLCIRIKVALIDRGIARSVENIAVLKDCGVRYLGLYQKYKNVKKIISGMKRKSINRKFRVKGVPTRLVIGKGKKKIVWVFVTDMMLGEFEKYLKLYKKRWNIETGFRVHDEARIKTKSTDVRIRYFLFLAAMLLYNVWKSLRIKISFKRFVIRIALVSVVRYEKPT